MATPSQVKAGLDDIAAAIRAERAALVQAKSRVTTSKNNLNGIPVAFADVIATIDGYGAGADDFERVAIAEKARLAAEFVGLRTKATNAETGLAAIDFTT